MSADTCYGNSQDVEGCNFGKLAVIARMLERIKLKEIINQHLPADVQAEFDHGTILNLLVSARLSDRGTFSVGHMLRMYDVGHRVICSVPWNDVRDLFDSQRKTLKWKLATFLSIEQHRRREKESSLPQEHYDLAVFRHEFHDDASGQSIAARVIFVFSTADQKVVRKQREKQIAKIRAELTPIAASVAIGRRGTDQAAISKRIARVFGTKQAAKYFQWGLKALTPAEKKPCLAAQQKAAATPAVRKRQPMALLFISWLCYGLLRLMTEISGYDSASSRSHDLTDIRDP